MESEGLMAAPTVTEPPCVHIAAEGLQSLGLDLEPGPFLGRVRVSSGSSTLPRAQGTVSGHLQAGPWPGCLSNPGTRHTVVPQQMLNKLNSTKKALGFQALLTLT